jgi:hypothetical protein
MGLRLEDVLWYRGPANKFFKQVGFYVAELLYEEVDIIFPLIMSS